MRWSGYEGEGEGEGRHGRDGDSDRRGVYLTFYVDVRRLRFELGFRTRGLDDVRERAGGSERAREYEGELENGG